MIKSLSSESSDILLKESESREQNNEKVKQFFQLLRVEIVGDRKDQFEDIYGFENIFQSIKDKAYNVTEQIQNKFEELGRVGHKLDQIMQLYESSEEQLERKQVLEKFKDEVRNN